jgi:hypothetical protein
MSDPNVKRNPDQIPPSAVELVPSLQMLVQAAGLNPDRLNVAFETDGLKHVRLLDKHTLAVSDGNKAIPWKVLSLQELFRGSRLPPQDMDHYPEEYTPCFYAIEIQLLSLCDVLGDRTDQEMEEVYTTLRRRPDGRSLGITHDFLWQVSALLLGTRILSGEEFEALVGALARSARKWGLRPVSRNYVAYLRKTFASRPGAGFIT